MRILIADDSTVVRERLIQLLADVEGIHIAGEADLRESKALTKKLRPDVVIVDVGMRAGDGGIGLLQDIKKINPAPKIVVLTNDAYPENQKRCLDGGADYFFDKSTEFSEMVSTLREMLAGFGQK